MSHKSAKVIGVIVLLALLSSLVVYVVAQPPGGFQGGGGQFNPQMMRFRGMGGGPAIAVAGEAVFVVANGMLLKYDANTLELLAQAELPQPAMPPMPAAAPQ